MTRRDAAAALLGGTVSRAAGPQRRPNILSIAFDDLNDWVGCLGGHPQVRTPNLDRFARQSVLFTNAHCAAPICNPSRTALLSGVRPSTSGVYHNPDQWAKSPALRQALPMPAAFRREGYRTMTVGKVFHTRPAFPTWREMWDEDGNEGGWPGKRSPLRPVPGFSAWRNVPHPHGPYFEWGAIEDGEQPDDVCASWAAERLGRRYDQPFFLTVGFYRPHIPLTAPQRFFDLYPRDQVVLPVVKDDDLDDLPAIARQIAIANWQEPLGGSHFQLAGRELWRDVVRAYLAAISYVDDCAGRVLAALRSGPNRDNTLVVVWSDNGWSLGDKLHWQKWGLWEQETRCLLAIQAPRAGQRGASCDAPVDFLHVYPTLLDLCGLPPRPEHEGVSLRPLIGNPNAAWSRPALTTFGPGNHSLRTRQWRYTRYADGSEELYDHKKDSKEWTNLAQRREAAAVKNDLAKWFPAKDAAPTDTPLHRDVESYTKPTVLQNESTPGAGIAGRSISIAAEIEPEGASISGVIYHRGGVNAGFALYINGGHLAMAIRDLPRPLQWNNLKPVTTVVTAKSVLPDGRLRLEGRLRQDGKVELLVNGSVVETGQAEGALSVDPSGPIMVGSSVSVPGPFPEMTVPYGDYSRQERFRGHIENVTVRYGDH